MERERENGCYPMDSPPQPDLRPLTSLACLPGSFVTELDVDLQPKTDIAAADLNGASWSEAVMNLNAANGSFRPDLPDNRHSAIPPNLPVGFTN